MTGNQFQNIILPTLFGVESVTAQELKELGFAKSSITVKDAEVILHVADPKEIPTFIARLNFGLRTAERVLLELAEFQVASFDELFDQVQALPWHQWLDKGYFIEITGYSRKSRLTSIPACQSIIKKAITGQLNSIYHYQDGQVPEQRRQGVNTIRFSIVDDRIRLMLDTTGDPLHKRGYRPTVHEAPLRETLAAAILILSFYQRNIKNGESLWDPFCGSGTFLIEAALMATGTAPGLLRHFLAEKYQLIGKTFFDRERELAKNKSLLYFPERARQFKPEQRANNHFMLKPPYILPDHSPRIFGTDIDHESVEAAQKNAARAGVLEMIDFQVQDIRNLSHAQMVKRAGIDRLLIVTNPPYGERLADAEQTRMLEKEIKRCCFAKNNLCQGIRLSVLTSDRDFEKNINQRADKHRKLYNGGLRCTLYHFFRDKQ